jgi:hypothetical protein
VTHARPVKWIAPLIVAATSGCFMRPTFVEEPTPAAEDDAMSRPFLAPLYLTEDPVQDAIVRVVGSVSCTGTLIAEDLVLTAHHCVVEHGPDGKAIARDLGPESVHVELGGDDLPWGDVSVRAVVTPACGYEQGDGDLAILVLERKLVGMPNFTPRLTKPPVMEEEISPWGFGRCTLQSRAVRRESRVGGKVDRIVDGVFSADASICPGDSGGPVLDKNREVVGVISASVMDTDARTRGRSHFARLDKYQQLFSAAQEIASGRSPSELPPFRACE